MSKIVIGFSKPKKAKPVAWLIMKWQKTPFSHTYVKVPRDSGVHIIYQASGHTVNFVGANVFSSRAQIVEEFTFEISDDSKSKFFDWAIEHSGEPYSVLKGFGIFLARCFGMSKNPFSKESGFVCSTLVGIILKNNFPQLNIGDTQILGPKEVYEFCVKGAEVVNSKI